MSKKVKRYKYEPDPDMFVSEILCKRCKHKMECYPGEDLCNVCEMYRAVTKLMP